MNENNSDVSDQELEVKPYRRLVLYSVLFGFPPYTPEEELATYDFGGSQIMVCIEADSHADGICIETLGEVSPKCLADLCATLSLIFASDKRNNIDFRRGLVLCEDDLRGNKWKHSALLQKNGTFVDCEIGRK